MCDSGFNTSRMLGGDPTGQKGIAGMDMDMSKGTVGRDVAILAALAAAPYVAPMAAAAGPAIQGGMGNMGAGIQNMLGQAGAGLGSFAKDPIGVTGDLWNKSNEIPIDFTTDTPGRGKQDWTNAPFRAYKTAQEGKAAIEKYGLKPKVGPKGTEWSSPDVFERIFKDPTYKPIRNTIIKSMMTEPIRMIAPDGTIGIMQPDKIPDALDAGYNFGE